MEIESLDEAAIWYQVLNGQAAALQIRVIRDLKFPLLRKRAIRLVARERDKVLGLIRDLDLSIEIYGWGDLTAELLKEIEDFFDL